MSLLAVPRVTIRVKIRSIRPSRGDDQPVRRTLVQSNRTIQRVDLHPALSGLTSVQAIDLLFKRSRMRL
ncbi:hypothetical protein LNAOJCKE_1048 [Methylorubrum aminovorans]|uniref:Uncharacterized protein n=1 Tax=Methylorubrum aminovorans TaxID=269069 RepID=A0ABQ4U8Y2_9HYPH|nr:hypothetical protein LNAOJCKE_1048 [Methylorubrum aminovorans]